MVMPTARLSIATIVSAFRPTKRQTLWPSGGVVPSCGTPTIVGIPPMEDFYMGGASVKLFLPIFKMNFPEIVDIALPAEGVFHNLVFVSNRKTYPMQAYKVLV